ncbi:hypothetical protein HAX54_047239 [Datura stramonium]|uniref:CW-type domain-containing protein n=1 Tax=Datura stramonium TaxID=4076 RepID=A0ABS8SSQ8_DATST|nr:hypothetical protein [Datura stramonium]
MCTLSRRTMLYCLPLVLRRKRTKTSRSDEEAEPNRNGMVVERDGEEEAVVVLVEVLLLYSFVVWLAVPQVRPCCCRTFPACQWYVEFLIVLELLKIDLHFIVYAANADLCQNINAAAADSNECSKYFFTVVTGKLGVLCFNLLSLAAVDWMLQRERNVDLLQHPSYMDFVTEDGFAFYINAVSGQIATGQAPKSRISMGECSVMSLGWTLGTLAEPPDGAQVIWCMHNADWGGVKRKLASNNQLKSLAYKKSGYSHKLSRSSKRFYESSADNYVLKETWIQCDACHKWRRLAEAGATDTTSAWFCRMNTDPLYQSCSVAEDSWDHKQHITCLPGFHSKGTPGGLEENVSVYQCAEGHYSIMDSEAKKTSVGVPHAYLQTFQAFGLVKRAEKGITKWYYPRGLVNLVFDLDALRVALCKPLIHLDYLSLPFYVVPSNLVDHWRGQIERHVGQGQLRVFVWTDYKRPSAHSLAWDYDVVIIYIQSPKC